MVTVFEKEGPAKKFFVSSGTITINDDSSVQILAEEAHPVEDIDAGAAQQVRWLGPLGTDFIRIWQSLVVTYSLASELLKF